MTGEDSAYNLTRVVMDFNDLIDLSDEIDALKQARVNTRKQLDNLRLEALDRMDARIDMALVEEDSCPKNKKNWTKEKRAARKAARIAAMASAETATVNAVDDPQSSTQTNNSAGLL